MKYLLRKCEIFAYTNAANFISHFVHDKIFHNPKDYFILRSNISLIIYKLGDFMISFNDITTLFSYKTKKKYCIEIEFSVKDSETHQCCWMGKMPDPNNKDKELFWFGLATDGSEAYDYDNFKDFSCAPVFDNKSLKNIWNNIELLSIDGIDPEERLQHYIEFNKID